MFAYLHLFLFCFECFDVIIYSLMHSCIHSFIHLFLFINQILTNATLTHASTGSARMDRGTTRACAKTALLAKTAASVSMTLVYLHANSTICEYDSSIVTQTLQCHYIYNSIQMQNIYSVGEYFIIITQIHTTVSGRTRIVIITQIQNTSDSEYSLRNNHSNTKLKCQDVLVL